MCIERRLINSLMSHIKDVQLGNDTAYWPKREAFERGDSRILLDMPLVISGNVRNTVYSRDPL